MSLACWVFPFTREGAPTLDNVAEINMNCLCSTKGDPPAGTQVACFANATRDAINTGVFEECCVENATSDGLVPTVCLVFMDDLGVKNAATCKAIQSNRFKSEFYSNRANQTTAINRGAKFVT